MRRAPAPGGLALVEALVNTLDIETGADSLDTTDGRAAFGLAERDVPAARELREALRAACLAHAGHRAPGRSPAALDELLARAPLHVTVAEDGSAALRPADPGTPRLPYRTRTRRGGRRRDLGATEGLRGGGLPVGVLRPQPGGPAPLVLDVGVRGARQDAYVPGPRAPARAEG